MRAIRDTGVVYDDGVISRGVTIVRAGKETRLSKNCLVKPWLSNSSALYKRDEFKGYQKLNTDIILTGSVIFVPGSVRKRGFFWKSIKDNLCKNIKKALSIEDVASKSGFLLPPSKYSQAEKRSNTADGKAASSPLLVIQLRTR